MTNINIHTPPPSPPPGTAVNIQVGTEDVVLTKTYYYSNSTSPNLGLSVILYRMSTVQKGVLIEIDRLVTGENGLASFTVSLDDMITGDYEIRTYGSYTISRYYPLGDWEKFHFDNPNDVGGTGTPDLVLFTLPTFNVSETANPNEITVDINKAEYTTAVFSLTNISINEGRIASVVIEYRRYGLAEAAYYTQLKVFAIDGDTEITSLTLKTQIALFLKPTCYYDFRCYIQGVNGEWSTFDGNKVELTDLQVPFDGVTDLPEYIEVEDLVVTNANDPESGILPGVYAELAWTEIRNIAAGFFPRGLANGFTGATYQVSYNQAQRISGYGVFMYVTESGVAPTNEYPVSGISDTGIWYYMGDFEKAYAKIRCPEGMNVAFWAGMRSHNTSSQIVKNYIKI